MHVVVEDERLLLPARVSASNKGNDGTYSGRSCTSAISCAPQRTILSPITASACSITPTLK